MYHANRICYFPAQTATEESDTHEHKKRATGINYTIVLEIRYVSSSGTTKIKLDSLQLAVFHILKFKV